MSFWERFYDLCLKHNTKPNAVCNTLGYSTATATHWKNGTIPKGEVLIKLADFFDCSVDFLLGRSEKSNNTNFRVFSTTPEQRENARLQRMVTTFEELNTEAQEAVLDYVSYIASQPKNLKNEAEDYSNQMKA